MIDCTTKPTTGAACSHGGRTKAWATALIVLAFICGVVPARAQNAAADRAQAIALARSHAAANAAVTHFGPDQDLVVRDAIIDADGTEHVRFDRTYRGLRVVGGDLVMHTAANGQFTGVSQTLSSDLTLSTQPSLAPQGADPCGHRAVYQPQAVWIPARVDCLRPRRDSGARLRCPRYRCAKRRNTELNCTSSSMR